MTMEPSRQASPAEWCGESAPASDGATRPIVAFDFDGTLTVRDTFNAFLWCMTPPARRWALLRLAPELARYIVSRDRGRLKAAAVHAILRGRTRVDLQAAATRFADDLTARLLRPDALATWEAHRVAGRRLVIVTASPDLIIAPFAERLGADRLIGTRLEFDRAGRATGRLCGLNCRGPEKVRRLREAFGPDVRLAAAYGDTAGDREMLAIADQPFMKVFNGRPRPRRQPPS